MCSQFLKQTLFEIEAENAAKINKYREQTIWYTRQSFIYEMLDTALCASDIEVITKIG